MKTFILAIIAMGLVSACQTPSVAPVAQMTLITNVTVIDGTGAPSYPGSLRIHDGIILEVGDLTVGAGDTVIDGDGKILVPGFIDTHSHHDRGIFSNRSSTGAASQGITKIVVGQDGGSNLPLEDFFIRLEETPPAVNVASFSGHGSVRVAVMGNDFHRVATEKEITAMKKLVEADMAAGALGLATGLEYEQGVRSTTDEVVELASVAGAAGGRYISHMRSEDTYFWEALEELIDVGRRASLPVQVSHIKLAKVSSWGETERLIERLNAARKAGVDVTADIYPYTYWSSTIRVFFPDLDYDNPQRAAYAVTEVSTPEGIYLAAWAPDPSLQGKTLGEIAILRGKEPSLVLMDMIVELEAWEQENGRGQLTDSNAVIAVSMTEPDIAAIMQWEHTNISSDGADGGGHPRGYGAFPRVLGHYSRNLATVDLVTAIYKMTGLSAAHMGITTRGTIAPGKAADLVLLNPETVIDRATIENPTTPAIGILKVWVNGELVYANGETTGVFPGEVVRREEVQK